MATTRSHIDDSNVAYLKDYFSVHDESLYQELLSHFGLRLFRQLFQNISAQQVSLFLNGKSDDYIRNFFRVSRRFAIYDVSFYQNAFLTLSDRYNEIRSQMGYIQNYNEIVPGLYLGRYPHADGFDIIKKVGLLVSTIEDYEPEFGVEHWHNLGIEQIIVPIEDQTAQFSPQDILNACRQIKVFMDAEKEHQRIDPSYEIKQVYVHCKAGRSRSGTFVLAYLAMYGREYGLGLNGEVEHDIGVAHEFIKHKRQHLKVEHDKLQRAKEALELFQAQNARVIQPRQFNSQSDYLASIECKEAICKLTSFHALREYGVKVQSAYMPAFIKPTYRTNHARDVFLDILFSTDAKWLDRLVNKEGAVKLLLDADKGDSEYGNADKAKRAELVNNFIAEVQKHLAEMNLPGEYTLPQTASAGAASTSPPLAS